MLHAITRQVSRSIARCELTHLDRQPIDLDLARKQHREYENLLTGLGVSVRTLPEEPELPDSVFVEDAAVVLDECALITLPGAVSRRPETASIADALAPHRLLLHLLPPAALDGGDVLVIGKNVMIGQSSRSNRPALDQVQALLAPFGYSVSAVPVTGCLHLKSAACQLQEDRLLINPAWVSAESFPGMACLEVDPREPYAANVLLVAGRVICQPAYPRTIARLVAAGNSPLLVDASELGKAEGALTCCSLIFTVQ